MRSEIVRAAASCYADRLGNFKTAFRTLSTFSGVRVVLEGLATEQWIFYQEQNLLKRF